jgi:hypothetical protein
MKDPESRSPDADPRTTANRPDSARYTEQQEREMGAKDDGGRTIQPQGAFVMIALTFVGVAAVAAVVIVVILRFSGAPVAGQ